MKARNTNCLNTVEMKSELIPDMNERIRQKWGAGQEKLTNKELNVKVCYVNSSLNDIIESYAKATRKSISRTMIDFLWMGILIKDQERINAGKTGIKEISDSYGKKKSAERVKRLTEELKQEKIKIINKIFD